MAQASTTTTPPRIGRTLGAVLRFKRRKRVARRQETKATVDRVLDRHSGRDTGFGPSPDKLRPGRESAVYCELVCYRHLAAMLRATTSAVNGEGSACTILDQTYKPFSLPTPLVSPHHRRASRPGWPHGRSGDARRPRFATSAPVRLQE